MPHSGLIVVDTGVAERAGRHACRRRLLSVSVMIDIKRLQVGDSPAASATLRGDQRENRTCWAAKRA